MWAPKTYIYFWAFLLLLGGLVDPSSAQDSGRHSQTVLSAGDAIRITVWRRPELSGDYAVDADGAISHPLYREIKVTNVALDVIEQRVHDFLLTLEASPQFVIQPLLRVSVGGEVKQPNLYRLPPETSIAEAIALAGGVSDRGRLDRIKLVRNGEQMLIDLTNPDVSIRQETIRSGDQLFVARRISVFREYIAPAGSILGALISLANILTR